MSYGIPILRLIRLSFSPTVSGRTHKSITEHTPKVDLAVGRSTFSVCRSIKCMGSKARTYETVWYVHLGKARTSLHIDKV